MEVVVTYDNPRNVEEWNALCKECGNYLQTTMQSEMAKFSGQRVIYFEVVDSQSLIGGGKLSVWQSVKIRFILPTISKTLSQFGEFIINHSYDNINEIISMLNNRISEYIEKENIVSFSVKGFYSSGIISRDVSLLYENNRSKCYSCADFDVAYIDLRKSYDDLYKDMHVKHRNMVNRAVREGLIFENIDCNSEVLNMMLAETYSMQGKSAPSPKYIERETEVGNKNGICKMFVCRKGEEILSCALVNVYGRIADYSFGGNRKNDCGAGQFLQYNICKYLKDIGVEFYSLGQVARNIDESNLKFTEGITRFKMRFGCETHQSSKHLYVFAPIKYKIWNVLCKVFINK